ncbi:MAG: hypothetical protein A2008_02735 [Candidatus Wallbacteria bacterium GWC2_49_35]|uniref:DUF454 domain-containing protein n=1 Tax=Candidatus Wallbacteria bacterium GWC2_49_35 TaxID=1817813 RepID=A0A1F7WN48_9BACT|nr:MAG: hypothetical protein A2008_02735 [Candidatus Wallbacteria bacterium GWC2_49_35]HBC76843.1 DUF454 domain-containing protein [Candidatus Wallbacteria bacterium]
MKNAFKKYALISAGLASTALGVAGIFIPLLPTTPFLLLAAACFLRSSDSLYEKLTTHKILGEYIRNYSEKRAVALRTKITAIALLWLSIGYSVIYIVNVIYIKVILLVIAACVTAHLVSLNTLR